VKLELIAPGFLLLAALVPLVWFLPRRLHDVPLGVLRSAVLLLIVLAATRPVLDEADTRAWHVFVLDESASLSDVARVEAREAVRAALSARSGHSPRRTLITLGVEAEREQADRHVRLTGDSPLGAALAAAGRSIPWGMRGSVTLVSDGLATDPHWGYATAALRSRSIPVHTLAAAPAPRSAAVVGIVLPDLLRAGATARVRVDLVGAGVVAHVRLSGPDGELARSGDIALDDRTSVLLEFEPDAPGYLPLTARVEVSEGLDTDAADNELRTTAAVQDPLRVLYLGARMVDGGLRLAHLVGPGLDVQVRPEGEVVTPADVAAADLVVLDDRPADTIPAPVQRAIVSGVRDGRTGLLMCGGRAAFGAGGYQRSPIAAVLPVEMVQKEEKRDPSTTLAVVIDTSGSMGGNRVQLAKEVARLAIRRLLPHDKVGIVEFYGAKRWAAPIQPASNAIEIQRALNRLNAGGGTVIMPAIDEAFYGLQNVRTRYKHVLVLTDGGVEQGAFEPLIRRMAVKGITVSTVLIGPDAHSEFLVSIANWGKGRFYSVPNRFNLPEILLKQPASAHLPSWRPGLHAVDPLGGPGWWGAVESAKVPPLAGYVEARARTGAQTLLEVRSTKHPVLATWRYGAGRATVLLTEPTGPGTEPWRDWKDYGAWLARLMARSASDTREPFRFELVRRGRELILSARRLLPGSMRPEARREGGAQSAGALAFHERAPGFFQARFEAAPADEVRVLAGTTRLVSPAHADGMPEKQVDPRRALDLAALSAATGGDALELGDADGFVPRTGGASAPIGVFALWPLLLGLALLLYLAELFHRRRSRSLHTETVR